MKKKKLFIAIICTVILLGYGCNQRDANQTDIQSNANQTEDDIISNVENVENSNTTTTKDQEKDDMKEQDGRTEDGNILDDQEYGVTWENEVITVYEPRNGGVWYPRMYQLSNGTILCGFDTNEDGGRAVIKIVRSVDGGLTWSGEAIQATNYPEYDCANANFIELENGELWVAYRANVAKDDVYYSSIRVSVSKDGGITWEPHSIVAEEEGTGGVYEPQFGYIGDAIAVFYANDSLNVVRNGRQQNIEFKVWEEDRWSDKIIASDGTKTFSRDGMPVWCQLEDGSYALVIEATSLSPSYDFIIQMKTSVDGLDWSGALHNIYLPNQMKKKAGAPYIVKIPDGRVAVSFQTDEDATKNGDAYSKMKVMISKDATASEFLPATVPFDTPDGFCSNWNSLLSNKDYLYAVTSTNYPSDCILLKRGSIK
jgi:hypothetical protein